MSGEKNGSEDLIQRRVCAGLVLTEVKNALRDSILGLIFSGSAAVGTLLSPTLGGIIAVMGIGYFAYRCRILSQNKEYLVKKYGLGGRH